MFKQFFICAALVAALVAPSNAQQSPPASEQTKQIEALVNNAVAQIDSKGKAVFPEFRKQGSEWWFGDTYLFVYDTKLNVLLVAALGKIKQARRMPKASCTMTSL